LGSTLGSGFGSTLGSGFGSIFGSGSGVGNGSGASSVSGSDDLGAAFIVVGGATNIACMALGTSGKVCGRANSTKINTNTA
jgi:hypothetical protein